MIVRRQTKMRNGNSLCNIAIHYYLFDNSKFCRRLIILITIMCPTLQRAILCSVYLRVNL